MIPSRAPRPAGAWAVRPLLAEGVRLFFPVAALHAMVWPVVWTVLFAFDLPLADTVPTRQWHAHEMIFGTYGAALAGFLTSAVAEWTDTPPRQGRPLLRLLALWVPGRVIGLAGADRLVAVAAATDAAFFVLLVWYVLEPMLERRSTRHAAFVVWTVVFTLIEVAIRIAWLAGAFVLAERLIFAALHVFLVFLSLALGRINVVVMNLALDPSGDTTPYRPHPGRQNLSAGIVALYAGAALAFPSSRAPDFLALAAGAAFFDRLAEWFIGRALLRTHVLALAAANAAAGLGFVLIGLAGLGLPLSPLTGVHVLAVGSLGLAVVGVFVIAGLRHTGRPLVLPAPAHAAVALMLAAGLVRTLPELGVGRSLLGTHYALAALLWAAAFGTWLIGFLPLLGDERTVAHRCDRSRPVPSGRRLPPGYLEIEKSGNSPV